MRGPTHDGRGSQAHFIERFLLSGCINVLLCFFSKEIFSRLLFCGIRVDGVSLGVGIALVY